jgi:hypothetical protein
VFATHTLESNLAGFVSPDPIERCHVAWFQLCHGEEDKVGDVLSILWIDKGGRSNEVGEYVGIIQVAKGG